VTEKLPLLIADGLALTVDPDSIVIGSRPGVELVSTAPLTVAALNPAVWKSASGRTPPLPEGASAITSAEPSFADRSFWVVVCVHPRVTSVRVSVNDPRPSVVTDALNLSPGATTLE